MTSQTPSDSRSKGGAFQREIVLLLKSILPAIVLVGIAFAFYFVMSSAPSAEKSKPERRAHLVEVVKADPVEHQILVPAQGRLEAAKEVTLNPQVAGEIIQRSPAFEPGGFFKAGERIVTIDPADYELAEKMRRADVTRMEAQRVLEKASQNVAQREYEVLGQQLDDEEKSLVLREPQLASAAADVDAARAMLDDAALDLDRTRIEAPFDAQVMEKYVDVGTRLSTQTPIARLVGTETYWVLLSVAQGDLRWVNLPREGESGSRVKFSLPKVWGEDKYREGQVIRLLPEISPVGRMARLLVAIDDPLCLKTENRDKPRLLVTQYLIASIEGKSIENAVVVDRRMLRNGDRVWLMNDKDQLEIRDIEISYRGQEHVVVESGLGPGDRIIATDIGSVSEGMALRLAEMTEERPDAGEPASKGQS
jgi:RND family efflux transporter MFP subunit